MGATTGIGWTDATINFWWGCTEVGPGCELCYARTLAETRWKRANWGDEFPRVRTSDKVWNSVFQWDKKAEKDGKPIKVFCQSMSDFFDKRAPSEWREEGWARIKKTKHLRYQILTKRITLIEKMLPADWGPEYSHVGFMCTVVNQQEANRDVPRLLKLKQERNVTWVGLSIEPYLEHIFIHPDWINWRNLNPNAPALDWIIIGGESAQGSDLAKCRPYDMNSALGIVELCQANNTAVFHKQLGSRPYMDGKPFKVAHWKGEVPEQWPQQLRIQQFPQALLQ